VVREAAAPVFRGDQVRAIVGVGNKPADYTAADLDAIATFGDLAFDITDRKRTEDELRTSEQRYRSLFEHSLDGILLAAPDGRILAANPAACRLLDRDEDEICALGRAGIVDPGDPRGQALVEQRARTGEARGPLTLLRRDGAGLEVELATAVFEAPEGPRAYVLLRDLTERRRMEGVLTEAARIGNLGYWSRDFANDLITWSDEALKILGLSRDQGPFGIDAHLARVHPDDREMMRRVYETAQAGGSPWTVEYRIVREEGDVRWLRSQGEVEKDPNGRPIGASGVFRDITRDKAALPRRRWSNRETTWSGRFERVRRTSRRPATGPRRPTASSPRSWPPCPTSCARRSTPSSASPASSCKRYRGRSTPSSTSSSAWSARAVATCSR